MKAPDEIVGRELEELHPLVPKWVARGQDPAGSFSQDKHGVLIGKIAMRVECIVSENRDAVVQKLGDARFSPVARTQGHAWHFGNGEHDVIGQTIQERGHIGFSKSLVQPLDCFKMSRVRHAFLPVVEQATILGESAARAC